MSLQDRIDKQVNSKKHPRGSIMLTGGSGSFTLPEGVRLVLKGASGVTCDSNEGSNELSFIDCQDVTVTGFRKGILRFDYCQEIQEISTEEEVTLHVSDAKIQTLDLKGTQGVLAKCEIQDCTVKDSDFSLVDNKFQGTTEFEGCRVQSDGDSFESEVTIKSCVGNFNKPEFQSQVTVSEGSVLSINKSDSQDCELTVEKARVTLLKGSLSKVTITDQEAQVILRGPECEIQDDLEIENGTVSLHDVTGNKGLIMSGGVLTANRLTLQEDLSITDSQAVILESTITGKTTLETSAVKLSHCTLSDDLDATDGALESEDCTYSGKLTQTGGTISSSKDEFSDKIDISGLIYRNRLYRPQGAQEASLGGSQGALIEVIGLDTTMAEISDFSKVDLIDCSLTEATIRDTNIVQALRLESSNVSFDNVGTLGVNDGQIQTGDFQDCGTVMLDRGSVETATFTQCGTVVAPTCSIQDLTTSDCVLVVAAAAQTADITGGTFIDSSSSDVTMTNTNAILTNTQVTQATDCAVMNNSGTLESVDGSMVSSKGGSVGEATGESVITMCGGSVVNTDGLTMGTGFSPDDQAGCLLYDGDLTLQASVGKVKITSLLDSVEVQAAMDISMNADMNILMTALVDIDMAATMSILGASGTSMDWNAGEEYSVNAGLDVTVYASEAFSVDSNNAVIAGASTTDLLGGVVTINGGQVWIN